MQSVEVVYSMSHDWIAAIHLPTWDMENGAFRAWWFDPLVASLGFLVFINWYRHYERRYGVSADKDFVSTLKIGWSPVYNSFATYWIGIYALKCAFPPPANGSLPDGIPEDIDGVLYLMAELVCGIILYDAVFFFIHWAMHEIPFLRSWHMTHHSNVTPLESRDSLRHSILDGSLQVLVNIHVQLYTPWGQVKSRLARALHNVVVIWMLTESHSAAPVPYIWRRWFVGVREHRLHHHVTGRDGTYGKHHRYQQFFGYLDDLRVFLSQEDKLVPENVM